MAVNNNGCFSLIALLRYTTHDVQDQYRQFAYQLYRKYH